MKTQDNSQDRVPKTAKSNIDDIMRIEQEFLQQRSFGDRLSDMVSALAREASDSSAPEESSCSFGSDGLRQANEFVDVAVYRGTAERRAWGGYKHGHPGRWKKHRRAHLSLNGGPVQYCQSKPLPNSGNRDAQGHLSQRRSQAHSRTGRERKIRIGGGSDAEPALRQKMLRLRKLIGQPMANQRTEDDGRGSV